MSIDKDFSDLAAKAPQTLASMSLQQAEEWMTLLEQVAAEKPALAATAEDAFIKALKTQAMYSDVFSSSAANLDAGRDSPDKASKMINSFMPGIDQGGIEGLLRKDALVFPRLAKLRGADAHPAIRFYAEESAKLTDDNFKDLSKPLRLLIQTIAKAKAPVVQAPRPWVGDKPKRAF